MDSSKQLITALEKADWLDRLLVLAALMFFIVIVLFIIKQRIVDRSVRLAFWWTRFLPNFGDDEKLLMQEEGGITMSSVLETVSTMLSSLQPSETASSLANIADSAGSIAEETFSSLTSSILDSATETVLSHVEL